MKAIINGDIILRDRVLKGKALVFGKTITDIIDMDKLPSDCKTIDAKGGYVSPGLIDIHIHGYLGEDVSDAKPEGIKIMAQGIVKNGVTGWLATTMTVEKSQILKAYDTVRSLMEESRTWNGAALLGVNSEGPFVNAKRKGAQLESAILPPDAAMIVDNADVVKIVTLAPEMDPDFKAIKEISDKSSVVVSMGHTDADYETACASIDCGVKHVTHVFNAMTPLAHRNPGVVGAAFDRDVTTELIADTFHIHKGLFSQVAKIKGDKLVLITDCVRAGGLEDGEYTLGGQKIFVEGIECRMEDGTIAGSVLTLNKAVKNMYANTDLPLYDVIACASATPARIIGMDGKKGSIAIGKDADIAIFDKDFNVKYTIIGGKIKYEA